jgi:hypothetical protein
VTLVRSRRLRSWTHKTRTHERHPNSAPGEKRTSSRRLTVENDLDETIRRLKAYAAAGADCLYAPGIKTGDEIAAVVQAVAPKPVSLVIGRSIGLTAADVAALGVRRISLGCALARAAWGGFMRAVSLIALDGPRGPSLTVSFPRIASGDRAHDDSMRTKSCPIHLARWAGSFTLAASPIAFMLRPL